MDDVVPEGIHHQLADAVRIVQLVEVLLADAVGASLKALLHHIRAEFLDGKDADLANDALADGVDLVVPAHVQHVLNDVVAVGILHQLEGLLDDTRHQVRPGGAMTRVEAALDDAAAVAMARYVLDARGDGVEDELGVLVRKLEQNPLNRISQEKDSSMSESGPDGNH